MPFRSTRSRAGSAPGTAQRSPRAAQLPRRSYLRIEDLQNRPLVMFRAGYDLREATISACRAAGFEPRFAVEGGEMDAVLRFVEVGLGIAVVPSMVLAGRPGLRGTPLVLADEETRRGRHGPGLLRTIALAHRKDVELTHAARAFQETLQTFLVEAALAGSLPAGVETLVTA